MSDDWKQDLNRLLDKYPDEGCQPDAAMMTELEQFGLYRKLQRREQAEQD